MPAADSSDIREEPQGQAFLAQLIDTVADGEPPSQQLLLSVHRFLSSNQAKMDLAQIGLVKYHLSRVKKLSGLIENIEDAILPDGQPVLNEEEDRVDLLKHIAKQLHLSVDFITTRASKPTTTSSEGMKVAADAAENSVANRNTMMLLSPEARQRIRSMTEVIQRVLNDRSAT